MNSPVLTSVAPGKWELVEPFTYIGFTIPKGFQCDLDSVPRVPLIYSRYKGRTVAAAVLHDFFYKRQIVSRAMADRLFLAGMALEGVPVRYCFVLYLAVRVGGWMPWIRNRGKL